MSYLDFDFPHSHMYDDDLKEIIAIVVKLSKTMAEFINMNVITFSEPINWDITKQYSKSVIVIDELGNAYLSKQEVPKGIELDNEDYWLEIFNFTDYVTKANSNLTFNTETAERSTHSYETDDWLLWNDLLYKVTSNIAVNDRLVIGTNITRFTVEEFCRVWAEYTVTKIQQYKNEIDASEREYKTQIDASELAYKNELERLFNDAISGVTVDSEVISARTGTDKIPYSVLKDAINDQIHGILFSNEFKTMYPVWNRKTLDSNLSIIDANNRCLTDAFTAGTVRVKFDSSMFIVVVRCDSEGNPTAKSENITTSPFLCSSTEKMRILTGKLDNTSINAATAASLVRISTSQMADEYYRQQDKDLNSIRYNYIPQWTREAYDNNNEVVSSTNRCLSSIIYATSVLINVEEGFEYIPVWLNSNGNVIGREQDWQPSGEVLLKGISNRLRICIRKDKRPRWSNNCCWP